MGSSVFENVHLVVQPVASEDPEKMSIQKVNT